MPAQPGVCLSVVTCNPLGNAIAGFNQNRIKPQLTRRAGLEFVLFNLLNCAAGPCNSHDIFSSALFPLPYPVTTTQRTATRRERGKKKTHIHSPPPTHFPPEKKRTPFQKNYKSSRKGRKETQIDRNSEPPQLEQKDQRRNISSRRLYLAMQGYSFAPPSGPPREGQKSIAPAIALPPYWYPTPAMSGS